MGTENDEEIPACHSCRRKKARCSRGQPCSQCTRAGTACVYDERKMKPGLRAGVVDSLSRRLETLENMFLGQEILWKQMWETLHPGRRLGEEGNSVAGQQESLRRALLDVAENQSERGSERPAKRQCTESSIESLSATDIIESDLLTPLVEFYFDNFHHWIPILHVRRFRDLIKSAQGREDAKHTLFAIIAACIRFVQDPRLGDAAKAKVAESCRQTVVLCSMESFSVGSLQALVIIAFDTVRHPIPWSQLTSRLPAAGARRRGR